jgi:hypothetical protein
MIEVFKHEDRFVGRDGVGNVDAEIEIAKYVDLVRERCGKLESDRARRIKTTVLVDPGGTTLVLPQAIAKQLGLEVIGQATVRYADNRTAVRSTVRDVAVAVAGRSGVYSAVVEPRRKTALLEVLPLEDMDLLVDCKKQRIISRDPRYLLHEIEQAE